MLRRLQSIESDHLQSAEVLSGSLVPFIHHTPSSSVLMATFSKDSRLLACVKLESGYVDIINVSDSDVENCAYHCVEIVSDGDLMDKRKGIACVAFDTDGSHLCVGIHGSRSCLIEFCVLRRNDQRRYEHHRSITLSPLCEGEDMDFPISKALCLNHVFFFLNLDNLCLAHDGFCNDTGIPLTAQGHIHQPCQRDFAVCNNYAACLNDSRIVVYSFALSAGDITMNSLQTIDTTQLNQCTRIIMDQQHIAVHSVSRICVFKKVRTRDRWVIYVDHSVPGTKDLFFNPDHPSTLCIVGGNSCSVFDLNRSGVSFVWNFDLDGSLIAVTYKNGFLGVCSSRAMTIFRM
jgi:hypothetical protein